MLWKPPEWLAWPPMAAILSTSSWGRLAKLPGLFDLPEGILKIIMPGYATSPLLYWVWFCDRLQGFWGLGCGVDLAPVIEDDTAYANCRFSFLRCMMRNYAHITCESPNSCTVTSRHVNQARNDWLPHTMFNKGLIGRFKVQGSGDACVMCCWAQWTWMVLYYADRLPLWVEDRGIK